MLDGRWILDLDSGYLYKTIPNPTGGNIIDIDQPLRKVLIESGFYTCSEIEIIGNVIRPCPYVRGIHPKIEILPNNEYYVMEPDKL